MPGFLFFNLKRTQRTCLLACLLRYSRKRAWRKFGKLNGRNLGIWTGENSYLNSQTNNWTARPGNHSVAGPLGHLHADGEGDDHSKCKRPMVPELLKWTNNDSTAGGEGSLSACLPACLPACLILYFPTVFRCVCSTFREKMQIFWKCTEFRQISGNRYNSGNCWWNFRQKIFNLAGGSAKSAKIREDC